MPRRKSDAVDGGTEHSEGKVPDASAHEGLPRDDEPVAAPGPEAIASDLTDSGPVSTDDVAPEIVTRRIDETVEETIDEPAAETADRIEDAFPTSPEDVPPPSEGSFWPPHEPVEVAREPEPEPVREAILAAPATEERHEEHEVEEEAGPSVASRLLTLLVAVIAGAGFGIWLAPKLAPRLPAGMAPVAEWLTPGQKDAEARLASLQAAFDGKVSELDARVAALPGADDVDARIAAAVSASATRIEGEVTSLKDAIAASAGGGAQERIAKLESAIEGQVTELSALRQQLGAAPTGVDATAKLDAYQAQLDGVKASVGQLDGNVATLSSRLDEVAATADRQVQAAQAKVDEVTADAAKELTAAQVDADLSQVRGALASGQPFADPLQRLAGQPGVTVPAGLTAVADSGVESLAQLQDAFPDAAHAAIRASIAAAAGGGVLQRAKAYLEAQVASRSLTPQSGDGTDAVLSRMEDKLKAGNLQDVLAESQQLPSEAAAAMQGWLDAAKARAAATDGTEQLGAALTPTTN